MHGPLDHQEATASRMETAWSRKDVCRKGPSGERRVGVPIGVDAIGCANSTRIPGPIKSPIAPGITGRGLRKRQRLTGAVEGIFDRNSTVMILDS